MLTKRPERMRAYLSAAASALYGRINEAARAVTGRDNLAVLPTQRHGMVPGEMPLPNVWLGVSAEDQKTADQRIPLLLQTPAAVRWVSAEPLLGPVDFAYWIPAGHRRHLTDGRWHDDCPACLRRRVSGGTGSLGWIVCGGESGSGARPMHPEWARSVRDQCVAAGVPFHFKQWGHFRPALWLGNRFDVSLNEHRWRLIDAAGHEYVEPEAGIDRPEYMLPVGKKAAGRLLDGREWNEFPEVPRA